MALDMTEDELADAWNALRNSALGRGTEPNVSPELAERVSVMYERWRKAHMEPGKPFAGPTWYWRWIGRYRELLAAVEAEGAAPAVDQQLPESDMEDLGTAVAVVADQVGAMAKNIAIGLGVLGVVAIGFVVLRK